MNQRIFVLLQLMVAHHILNQCICAPQNLVVPSFIPAKDTQGVGLGNTEFASSNGNFNVPPHPLQLLIDALMQPQNSAQVMASQFPRSPLNPLGNNISENTFLHRIGAHIMGIAEQHMFQTSATPLPSVVVALTTPPSVTTNQILAPSSSLTVPSSESVPIVTSVDSLERSSQAPTASLKQSTTTKPASMNNLPSSRSKSSLPSLAKRQGKKPIGKLPKLRNPTADDAVERRMAMIAKMEKKKNIATTTVKSIPNKTPNKPSRFQNFKPSTPILTKTLDTFNFQPIIGSNLIVSKADIIDSIVATDGKQASSPKSNINAQIKENPQSKTLVSRKLDVSSPLSSTNNNRNIPVSSSVTTSGNKFLTVIPVRSESILDFSQLFRRVALAAVKATTAAAVEASGDNGGHFVSIRPLS